MIAERQIVDARPDLFNRAGRLVAQYHRQRPRPVALDHREVGVAQTGRFNPWGTIVAVYFLATGITGLSMLGIPLWVTNVFNGAALILAVTISQITRGREASDIG